jgi:hypothetical protein
MVEHNVALCPTLAAGDAIAQYGGWNKGIDPDPPRIAAKKASFRAALDAGITICFGGDVGVYPHGDNVRELEMMVEYGMPLMDVLRAASSVNADPFHLGDRVGRIRAGMPLGGQYIRAARSALRHEGRCHLPKRLCWCKQ